MESIEKLAEAAQFCLNELKTIKSKISITEGTLANMLSKKDELSKQLADLESKKAIIMEAVGTLELNAQKDIDERMRQFRAKEAEVLAHVLDLKTKLFQADQAKADAESEKAKYASLYTEYLEKSNDLDAKRQALIAAIK